MTRASSIHLRNNEPGPWATAPYNFVRLPQQPMAANHLLPRDYQGPDPWEAHGRHLPGLHTGHLELALTTLTPLFIGGAHLGEDPAPSFRLGPGQPPLIPGSSVRGALAHILRVLAHARPGRLNDRPLWMRQPVAGKQGQHATRADHAATRTHAMYRAMRPGTVKAGFLEVSNGQASLRTWTINRGSPLKVRDTIIERDLVPSLGPFTHPSGINYRPPAQNPAYVDLEVYYVAVDLRTRSIHGADQTLNRPCTVVAVGLTSAWKDQWEKLFTRYVEGRDVDARIARTCERRFDLAIPPDNEVDRISNLRIGKARLVLTGAVGDYVPHRRGRQNTYLFPLGEALDGTVLKVDYRLVEQVNTKSQITSWQEETFNNGYRDPEGGLLFDGTPQPVWYELQKDKSQKDKVTSFGRAGGYRVRYPSGVGDMVPQVLRRNPGAGLDLADGLLGDVVERDRSDGAASTDGPVAWRGRLRFTHGHLIGDQGDVDAPPLRVDLLSPHAESFQHYLTQPSLDARTLRSYVPLPGEGERGEPRGFKFYWHRWDGTHPADAPNSERSQTIVPARSGLTFSQRIHFRNLSCAEIGLLLRAVLLLNQADTDANHAISAHKLGQGRPLGLGSVHIRPRLVFVDPEVRYTGSATGGLRPVDDVSAYLVEADTALTDWAAETGEPVTGNRPGWLQVDRLAELATLTRWNPRPRPVETHQMEVDDFKARRVLPDPLRIASLP